MRTEVVNRRGRELQARAVAVVDATGVTGRPWSGPARPVVPVVAPEDGTAGVVLPVDFSGPRRDPGHAGGGLAEAVPSQSLIASSRSRTPVIRTA